MRLQLRGSGNLGTKSSGKLWLLVQYRGCCLHIVCVSWKRGTGVVCQRKKRRRHICLLTEETVWFFALIVRKETLVLKLLLQQQVVEWVGQRLGQNICLFTVLVLGQFRFYLITNIPWNRISNVFWHLFKCRALLI